MPERVSAEQARQNVKKSIKRIREEIPQLSNLLDAFGELFAEQAALKIDLTVIEDLPKKVDEVSFSEGVPILLESAFLIPIRVLKKCTDRLVPALIRGFPKIEKQVLIISKWIGDFRQVESGETENPFILTDKQIHELAKQLNIDFEITRFAITQFIKPYAAKKAETMAELLHNSKWLKGYCPICGSWPEIAFLKGHEGRKWLKCSFCAYEWAFSRTECPFCESGGPDKLEILYSEDRPFERAELCHTCKKYLLSLDLRERVELSRDVAALKMIYLDILAQEKGFSPGSASAWNLFNES